MYVPRPPPSFLSLYSTARESGGLEKRHFGFEANEKKIKFFVVVYFVADTILTTHDLWTSNLCLLAR